MTKISRPILILCMLIAGCTTTKDNGEFEQVLNENQIHDALMNAKPPQQFGFNVYPVGNGIAMHGSARLHPRHLAEARFETDDVPVIRITGSAPRIKMNALLDTASTESWLEYGKAKDFKATFFGLDGRNIPYNGPVYIGEAPAYAAVISQMRIDQLFIENAPVFVRMATGTIGPVGRGIQKPMIGGVIGYDILQNFEFIQFDLQKRTVSFSSTMPYTPQESLLIGQAAIATVPGIGLAVEGAIDGQIMPVVLDFAGQYNFARSDASLNITPQVSLGEVVFLNVGTIMGRTTDGLPRAGNMMLSKYVITICPRAGTVYFERPGR